MVGRTINRWASVWPKSRLKLNESKKNDLLWVDPASHCSRSLLAFNLGLYKLIMISVLFAIDLKPSDTVS